MARDGSRCAVEFINLYDASMVRGLKWRSAAAERTWSRSFGLFIAGFRRTRAHLLQMHRDICGIVLRPNTC